MQIVQRLKSSLAKWLTPEQLVYASVRRGDVAAEGYYAQVAYRQLVQRCSGYVYVATMMTAEAGAALAVRLYRKRAPSRSAWRGRRLKPREVQRVYDRAGAWLKRSMSDDDGLTEITDPNHPVNAILRRANPRETGSELMIRLQMSLDLTGNGYIAAARLSGGTWPVELWPLQPQYVRALPDEVRFIKGYAYGTDRSKEQKFDALDMVHIRRPNPLGDPYYGMGRLAACLLAADTSSAIQQHQLSTLEKGMQPGGIIVSPGSSKEQTEGMRVEMERRFQGPDKSGKVMVSNDANLKWLPWISTEAELKFLLSGKEMRDTIANVYAIPVALLTMESAALAQAQEALPQWHEMSIKPNKRRIEDALNEHLLPMFGDLGEDLVICIDDPESRVDMARATFANTLYTGGILMQNEARDICGFDAVDGGDDFKADPLSLGFGGGFDTGDEQPAKDEKKDEPKKPDEPADEQRSIACGHDHEPAEHEWSDLFEPLGELVTRDDKPYPPAPWQRQMEDALRRWFRGMQPKVMSAVDVPASTVRVDLTDEGPTMAAAIQPKQAGSFMAAWNSTLAEITEAERGGARPIQSLTEHAEKYLENRRTKLLRSVTETVNGRLTDVLKDGIKAGDTLPQLAAKVNGAYQTGSGYAAHRIAATEASKAYNGGSVGAAQETGNAKRKEWLLSGQPCKFCRALAKRTVSLDGSFAKLGDTLVVGGDSLTLTYDNVDHPPLHPGCRCSVGFVFSKEVEEARA